MVRQDRCDRRRCCRAGGGAGAQRGAFVRPASASGLPAVSVNSPVRGITVNPNNANSLFVHTFENKLKTEIKTTVNCIYDIAINGAFKSNKIVCVSGAGPSIDVCANFAYRAFTLAL